MMKFANFDNGNPFCSTRLNLGEETDKDYRLARFFQPPVGRIHTQARNQYLFRPGESTGIVFLIRSGAVKLYEQHGAHNTVQILGFFMPGDIVGLDAVSEHRHSCAAVTLETCSVLEMPLVQLEKLVQNVPPYVSRFIYQLLLNAISNNYARLRLLGKKTAAQRLAGFLLDLSDNFAARGFAAHEFNLSMSRQDISSYLGLANATLSRLIASFQDQGLLSVQRRHVRIVDSNALRALAENDCG